MGPGFSTLKVCVVSKPFDFDYWRHLKIVLVLVMICVKTIVNCYAKLLLLSLIDSGYLQALETLTNCYILVQVTVCISFANVLLFGLIFCLWVYMHLTGKYSSCNGLF